ncbi:thiamine diphosphokinase [bacterium]|nr:MAG: thiamine diphosphokinase [bacterium]
MNRAIIFVNGNLSDLGRVKEIITKNDYIICADGGVKHALKLKLTPQTVIGDFDSISPTLQKKLAQKKIELIKFPKKKNETDFELALQLALKRNFTGIIIFGILGDRIDHLLANIFLITKIQTENQSIKIKIIEGNKEIFILNKKIVINGQIGDEISIIPVSEKLENIVTEGLEYQLDHETLFFGATRGVSNVMNKKTVKITLSSGIAVVEHNLQ